MYPYAPGQMGEKGEEIMASRGFPVCDHLKPTTKTRFEITQF